MRKLFNKTFFRFMLGFFAILVVSFTIIIATDFYNKNTNAPKTASPSAENRQ